ncbi:hypothetical protein HY638_04820 [Candidatus Woesearchaeota archaeon]|nr:hypothetical protein [Candidatus Woesearchaeota archaeon]
MNLEDRIKNGSVETRIFQASSPLSRFLENSLKRIILSLSDRENRAEYSEQLDIATKNPIIAAKGLYNIFTHHPVKGISVLNGIYHWVRKYSGAQKNARDKDRYLIYTQHDHKIPFMPEEDIMYTYMIAQISVILNELAGLVKNKELKDITEIFQDANDIAVEVFSEYPTTMPRFLGHRRINLKVIQGVDKPLNCCPSLHIAYSVLLDNIGESVIAGRSEKNDVAASIQYSTLRMFNSVLYTKQHSIVDVAFGILCARIAYERKFNRKFNDLTKTFRLMEQDYPDINYREIKRIYFDGVAGLGKQKSLKEIVGEYLKNNSYPLVKPGTDLTGCYFDTKRKEIVKA